jgi:hypothetical protein
VEWASELKKVARNNTKRETDYASEGILKGLAMAEGQKMKTTCPNLLSQTGLERVMQELKSMPDEQPLHFFLPVNVHIDFICYEVLKRDSAVHLFSAVLVLRKMDPTKDGSTLTC